ncbi:MAG: NAD+ synthase [Elainellaceae cyanobacterium]
MKLAIAQLNPTIGDLPGNAAKIRDAAGQAADAGAQVLITPEMSISGYPPQDLLLRPGFVAAMAQQIDDLAHQLPLELYVLVGYAQLNPQAETNGEKPLFNSVALLHQGQNQMQFHKQLLPTYDVFDDQRYFASASGNNLLNIDGTILGITVCEDVWNDESFWGRRSYSRNPLTDLVARGAELIINISGSPYSLGKQRLREAMLGHAATRHGSPILYVNQVGGNDDLIFDGSSVGINPGDDDNIACRAKAFAPDFLVVDFDPQTKILRSTTVHPLASSEAAELWAALILGVKDYVRKCGFSKVLLGLSGGIDSALVAAIAAAAVGSDNVLGILMPSPYSSDHSVSDAQQLAKNLGIRTETLPIKSLMQGYDYALSSLFANTEFGVAEENLQSRIRGNLLMALSNKFGYLLLSTGNKSEMAVGYCTLYGDMNGGLAVIADVPKTKVYAICHWLNQCQGEPLGQFVPQGEEIIPSAILEKAPSAELKPGQVDQDSLPSYEVLDDILDRLILYHQSIGEIEAAGHDRSVIHRVTQLLTRAEFKRRQAPPGLKVTDRAFGTGWRMPIASRVRYS